MKTLLTTIIVIIVVLIVLVWILKDKTEQSSFQKLNRKSDYRAEKSREPIIGAHGMNFTLFTNIPPLETDVYGVLQCSDDKNFTFHGSEFLTQSIGGNQGVLDTILIGTWKKIGHRQYHLRGEFVQLFRNMTNPGLPALPTYRWLADLDFTMSDNINGSWTGVATPHPVDDLTLSLPATGPFTGLVLEAEGITKKLIQ